MTTATGDARLKAFLEQKARLSRLAYRYLGTVADAEDVVQEAWLRFAGARDVRDAAPFLSTVVSRLCLDRLKSVRARREHYVGPWLPEPVTGEVYEAPDDQALDISYAVMRTLERLSPAERAAFFLHDLWGLSFDEVAATLSRSPEACRKLASRARAGLSEARQRFRPSREEVERFVSVFRASVAAGDPAPLKALLAGNVELVTDGGGKVPAALNIISGADAVGRFMVGVAAKNPDAAQTSYRFAVINDAPALLVTIAGKIAQTLSFDLDKEGHIRTIYAVRNPDKLTGLTIE